MHFNYINRVNESSMDVRWVHLLLKRYLMGIDCCFEATEWI